VRGQGRGPIGPARVRAAEKLILERLRQARAALGES